MADANPGSSLAQLLPQVQPTLREDWHARIAQLKAERPMPLPGLDDPRSHYGLVQAVADALDDSAFVATDVGQHQMWAAQYFGFDARLDGRQETRRSGARRASGTGC